MGAMPAKQGLDGPQAAAKHAHVAELWSDLTKVEQSILEHLAVHDDATRKEFSDMFGLRTTDEAIRNLMSMRLVQSAAAPLDTGVRWQLNPAYIDAVVAHALPE